MPSSFAGIWNTFWETPTFLIVLAVFIALYLLVACPEIEAENSGAFICSLHVLHDLRPVVGCGASQGEVSCRRIPH